MVGTQTRVGGRANLVMLNLHSASGKKTEEDKTRLSDRCAHEEEVSSPKNTLSQTSDCC